MKRFKICNPKSTICNSQRGFTLIEIAIVLIIIGILVALGAALIGPLTKRAKYNETKDIVSAAVESVISYGASNKKLPLQGDFTPDSTIDEFVEIVRNPKDAWTKTLYYVVEPNLTTIPAGSTDAICGRKTTDLIVCRDVNCTDANKITNVAFAVISGADNYNIQTGIITGGTCPSGKTCVRVYEVDTPSIDDCTNNSPSGDCPYYPSAEMITRQEPYDDIVKWVTLDELRIKAGCVGPQLKILNNELPYGTKCTVYATDTDPLRIFAEGGVPFTSGGKYRWCRQESGSTELTFSPSTLKANCLGFDGDLWGQADSLAISGRPTKAGAFSFTFFVRDNNDPSSINDNITQKSLVLSINLAGMRVVNATGGTIYYRYGGIVLGGIVLGPCRYVEDTASTDPIFPGETIAFYTTSVTCTAYQQSCLKTYEDLREDDKNCNNIVQIAKITPNCQIKDD